MMGLALAVLMLLAGQQAAQLAPRAGVQAHLVVENGALELVLRTDLDALLLGISPNTPALERIARMEALSLEDLGALRGRVEETLLRRVRCRLDGEAARLAIDFPEQRLVAGRLSTLGSAARFRAPVPETAREVSFFASRAFGGVRLWLSTPAGTRLEDLVPGQRSRPAPLAAPP